VGPPSALIDDTETEGKGWGWTGLGPAKHEMGELMGIRSRHCYWLSSRRVLSDVLCFCVFTSTSLRVL
jgi:hypothetical protein